MEDGLNRGARRPDLYPDRPITLTGFKAELNAQKWLIDEARHTMDGSGGLATHLLVKSLAELPI